MLVCRWCDFTLPEMMLYWRKLWERHKSVKQSDAVVQPQLKHGRQLSVRLVLPIKAHRLFFCCCPHPPCDIWILRFANKPLGVGFLAQGLHKEKSELTFHYHNRWTNAGITAKHAGRWRWPIKFRTQGEKMWTMMTLLQQESNSFIDNLNVNTFFLRARPFPPFAPLSCENGTRLLPITGHNCRDLSRLLKFLHLSEERWSRASLTPLHFRSSRVIDSLAQFCCYVLKSCRAAFKGRGVGSASP